MHDSIAESVAKLTLRPGLIPWAGATHCGREVETEFNRYLEARLETGRL